MLPDSTIRLPLYNSSFRRLCVNFLSFITSSPRPIPRRLHLPHTGDVARSTVAPLLLDFWRFFLHHAGPAARASLSVRDLLSWVLFINAASPAIGELPAYAHGAHLTLLDGIALVAGVPPATAAALRARCHAHLLAQLAGATGAALGPGGSCPLAGFRLHADLAAGHLAASVPELLRLGLLASEPPVGKWGLPPFYIPLALEPGGFSIGAARGGSGGGFELSAPTTARNAFRILRALQVPKAVLLEGSPGVGKTTLIAALAKQVGCRLGCPPSSSPCISSRLTHTSSEPRSCTQPRPSIAQCLLTAPSIAQCLLTAPPPPPLLPSAQVGQQLVRINLSEATDMMDLLGADLPAEGGAPGQVSCCCWPFASLL